MMGLPGDMNLELLHYMKDADLHWGEPFRTETSFESVMRILRMGD